MKKILLYLLGIIILLLIVISINALLFKSKQARVVSEKRKFEVDFNAVKHLSEAIQIKTVSYDNDSLTDYASFDTLISFLRKTYPLTFSKLDTRVINEHSLLLHFKSATKEKKPVILYAHMDVVPAENSSGWSHPPFEGFTDENFIYGRGVIDDKGSVIAIMETIEKLIAKGFQPSRDIYIAFGHDEEASGEKGARHIAEALEREGVKAKFLLDEGGLVATGMVPFVKPPVSLIFTSEKGYLTLELSVKGDGGHSGFPPADAPVEILAKAIKSIHDHPFEKRITQSVSDFMDYAGPEMRMPFKALFANRWLFKPIIFNEYEKIPSANAMIRTTAVATVIRGGEKENVVPALATAMVNFRLLPGDKSEYVINRIKEIIADERVNIRVVGKIEEASSVSSTDSEGFHLLETTISKVFPDAVVSPGMLIAQTDSRHFRNVTENIYRFLPVRMDDKILDTMHGTDERIGVNDFMETVEFYKELITSL